MKRYVVGMALPRNTALERIEKYDDVIAEHLLKLILFYDVRKDDINGWINTIAKCIYNISKVHPKDSTFDYGDYYDHCFNTFGTEPIDAETLLDGYQAYFCEDLKKSDKGAYPYFEVDNNLVEYTYDVLCIFKTWASELLSSDEKELDVPYIVKSLKDMLRNDCYLHI